MPNYPTDPTFTPPLRACNLGARRGRSLSSIAPAGLLLGLLVGTGLALAGFAPKIAVNTIDPVATISENGRLVVVSGPTRNDQRETNDQRVTVTQRSTGAVAEGRVRFEGSTTIQHWVVEARVQGEATFEPGEATAVALCVSTLRGRATDAHQWLVNITLEEKEED